MKKLCRIIISLAISITILFACFGIVDYTIKKVIPSFDKDLSLLNFTFSPLNYDLDNDGIVNYSERKFHIPTQSERLEMNNLIEKITKASKKSGYKQQILAMREQFFDRYYYPVFTSYTIAQIEYYKDTTNELWIKNYNDIYDYYVKIDEIALKLEQNLINSIYKEEIEKVTNYEYTTSIATSEQISEKQKQLNEQEKNLTNKYIQNRSNEQEMADILKNLVITRNNLAKTYKDKNGNYYENYLDFAYQKRYNRSYSPQQALDFCELILKYFKNFGYAMDNYRIFYINLTPKNEKTLKELTRNIIRNTSDQFTKTWDYMIERDL